MRNKSRIIFITAVALGAAVLTGCPNPVASTTPRGTPEMTVLLGTRLPSGSGFYDFGDKILGIYDRDIPFTVKNTGTASLSVHQVQITNESEPGTFAVSWIPGRSVAPGQFLEISMVFLPVSEGTKTATVSISGNDASHNPYTFTVSGRGVSATVPIVRATSPTSNVCPTWFWSTPAGTVNFRYCLDGGAWRETGGTVMTQFMDPNPLSPGSHTLEVQAQSSAGAWSVPGRCTITIDPVAATPPSVTGIALTNNNLPTWSWSTPLDAIEIRYRLDAGEWIAADVASFQTFIPSNALSEGSHTLEVQSMNADHIWSASGFFTTVIDLTAPSPPTVTGTSPTNNRTPTWTWTIPAGSIDCRYRRDGGSWTVTGGTSVTSYTPSSYLTEGSHTLEVQAKDLSQNWSASGSCSIIIDLTPPAVPLVTGASPTNDETPTWNWNVPAGTDRFRYRLDGATWTETGASTTTYTPESPLAPGSHSLDVQAGDNASNWSASGNRMISIDLTAPPAPGVTGTSPSNNSRPTWTWNIPAGTVNIRYRMDGGAWTTTGNASIASYTPPSALAEGGHTLDVQAQNSLLNWSASGSFTILVDVTPPNSPAVAANSLTNDATPTWNWTVPAGAVEFRYRRDNGAWILTGGTHVTSYTPTTDLSEGAHTLEVQARDDANNWSASGSFTVTIDVTPPAAPAVTGESPTNNATPTWNWTVPSGAADFRYRLDSSAWTTVGGTTVTSFTPASALTEGSHTLTVQACDSALNWSTAGSATIVIDLTPPGAPTVYGSTPTDDLTPTWNWSTPVGTFNFRYRLDGGDWTVTGGSGVTTFTPASDLAAGSHTLQVQAADAVGNWSASGSVTITIILSPPAAPQITSVTFESRNDYIKISWADNSFNETSFIIEQRIGNGAFETLASAQKNDTYYNKFSPITEETTYAFRIKAVNGYGESPFSNESSVTVPLFMPALDASYDRIAAIYGLTITWTDHSQQETGYILERSTDANVSYQVIGTFAAGSGTMFDSNLPEVTYINYRIRAVNEAGSQSANATDGTYTTMKAPTDFRITARSSAGITVGWTDHSIVETAYKVLRAPAAQATYEAIATLPANTTTYLDGAVNPTGTYFYKLYASIPNEYGEALSESVYTDTQQFVVTPVESIYPRIITATTITLNWSNQLPSQHEGFLLERKDGSMVDYVPLITLPPTAYEYQDSGLLEGQTYNYRICSFLGNYKTAYATATAATVLPSPSDLWALRTAYNSIRLTWIDNSTNAYAFRIERREGTNGAFTYIGSTDKDHRIYVDTYNFLPETRYEYRVRAESTGASSGYSNTAFVQIGAVPAMPVNPYLFITDGEYGPRITLSWEYQDNAIDGFQIQRYNINTKEAETTVQPYERSFMDSTIAQGITYTYHIRAYNAEGYSPPLIVEATSIPAGAGKLWEGSWRPDELTSNGQVFWYYFDAQAGWQYTLTWDDLPEGSGTKSADIKVSVYHRSLNEPMFTGRDDGYLMPSVISTNRTEIVYIKVEGYYFTTRGTFGIRLDRAP